MVETMVEVAKLAIMFNCGTKDIGRGQSDDRNVDVAKLAIMFNCSSKDIWPWSVRWSEQWRWLLS